MVSRSSHTDRGAFTLTEAMVGLASGVLLLGIAFAALTSGSRIGARAESKLAATADSELLFRKLAADLSSAVRPPEIEELSLLIATSENLVRWTFTPAATGRRSHAERRIVESAGASRYFANALTAATVTASDFAGHCGISLALTARNPQDAVPTVFQETVFLRGAHADPDWNPLN